MKKIISLMVAIALIISIGTSFVAAPGVSEVWVDDDFDPSTPGWGLTHFNSLQDGVSNTSPWGTLHLADGLYDGCIVQNPLTIVGEGKDLVTIDGDSPAITIDAAYFSISGCTITNGSDHNIYGVFEELDTEVHINDCILEYATVETTPDSGIHLEAHGVTLDVEITDCLIQYNEGDGIHIAYTGISGGTALIEDNEICYNDSGIVLSCGETLDDYVSVTATIRGNYVHNNQGADTGLEVTKEGRGCIDLDIISNAFINNGGDGIYVDVWATEDEPYIFLGNGEFFDWWSTILIEDNAIIGNGAYGIGLMYTVLDRYSQPSEEPYEFSSMIDITRNHIADNGNSGINVFCTVNGGDAARLGQDDNMMFLPFIIDKNRVVGNGNDGIHLDNCFVWFVMNNLVADNFGCSASGIALEHSLCFVVNNTIHNNEAHGIYNSGFVGSTLGQDNGYYEVLGFFVNNIVAENGSYGFYMPELPADSLGANGSEPGNLQSNNVWGNGMGSYSPSLFDFTGVYGNISQDPRFVSQEDRHLTRSSPCVDAGWDGVLEVLMDDLEGTSRPQARHVDMGCYELVWSSFTPETFHPLVITQLANANATWTCIMEHLPDDPELMEEIEPLLEEVQAHMGNATSISNYIQANGELRQALAIMAEIDAMCECECMQGP